MADILKSFTSNLIRFAAGERPSADKFNAMVSYFSRGMSDISRAIGDVYDVGANKPLHSAKWNNNTGKRRNLDILNLARIIGPASNLNSRMLNHNRAGKGISEKIPANTKEYKFKYKYSDQLVLSDSSLNQISGKSFTNENQFYLNEENNSLVFAKATTSELVVIYNTNPNDYLGGVNYIESGFNVIPDPNLFNNNISVQQEELLNITLVPGSVNNYYIDLPKVRTQQSGLNKDNYSQANLENINPGLEEYNYRSQIHLPEWMWNNDEGNLESGSIIPFNSLYLKDLTLGESFLTADYFYISSTRIEIRNVSLCLNKGHNFVLVTVGTDLTTSVDDLRLKWFRHTHDGTFGEEPINIKNLAGIFIKEHFNSYSKKITFTKSSIEDNHLPMYLHRIGYSSDTSINNGNNAMLGTLLMSRLEFDYQDNNNQPVESKDGISNAIYFGGMNQDGPSLLRDNNSNLQIKGQITFKEGNDVSPDINLISYENISSTASNNIVNNAENYIQEKALQIYDDYKGQKYIRYLNEERGVFLNQEYNFTSRETIDNILDSNLNTENHTIDYSTVFQSTDLFDTKIDLTVWKDKSDIQIREDIENTYTLQPKILPSIPDYYRPNLKKINNDSGTFEWLVYAGEVYKNGNTDNKIGCPAIGYKNLNIKEYILPIEDDNFILEYKDEVLLNSSENFDLPWRNNSGNVINNSSNHTHVLSFGELQQNNNISDTTSLSLINVLNENRYTLTNSTNQFMLPITLRLFRYISNNRRKNNYIDINYLFQNSLDLNEDRIQLTNQWDIQDPNNSYANAPYGEIVIFEGVEPVNWNNDIYQNNDYWKFRNGIFTHGYFSLEEEKNDDILISYTDDSINILRKYPKAFINENFAIYVVRKSTEEIYWLKPYFVTYNDFHMDYEVTNETNLAGVPVKKITNTPTLSDTDDADPYGNMNLKQYHDYTVLGNTIRFHIRPEAIGETNVTSFNNNINDYDFRLVHSFENEQNNHQTHDSYTYIKSQHIDNSPSYDPISNSFSWYTIQQSNNCFLTLKNNDYDYNKQNIVRYTDFAGHIKNAQYSGVVGSVNYKPLSWSMIEDNNYLLDINDEYVYDDYTNKASFGYYPIDRYLYSLPYGKEYIHSIHNQPENSTKVKINRWKDYGENSQYITILRKEPTNLGSSKNEVTRRFKIKALKNGDYNKEVIKFNLINFHYLYEKYKRFDTNDDGYMDFLSIENEIQNESYIEWLNIPNFVIKYTNTNIMERRVDSDFFFNSEFLDINSDSSYLNSNGSFNKPINIFINGNLIGSQYKKDVNLSFYLKKHITSEVLKMVSFPMFDYAISKKRMFSDENIFISFLNSKKSIFSNSYFHSNHVSSNIIENNFGTKWLEYFNSLIYEHIDLDNNNTVSRVNNTINSLKEETQTLNYIFNLTFILDVKEIINDDSIKLDLTFEIENLEINKVKTGI